MTVLVVGATGATGRLLLRELLDRQQEVRAIVRSSEKLPEDVRRHGRLTLVQASILDLSEAEVGDHVRGCGAIASCLGHNLTWKGILGPPRRLVSDATRRLCEAIRAGQPKAPVRFVLMNTAGNSNRDLDEPVSLGHRCVIAAVRLVLPPHVDNEMASDYLRTGVGQDDASIQWVVVRPDTLVDKDQVTKYEVHASPTRSAVFNPGSTSRRNVARFMADLTTDEALWNRWRGQMPVIYNTASS